MPKDDDMEGALRKLRKTIDAKWFERSFESLYPILYAHRTVEAAEPEVDFASRVLFIESTDRVLDLCCGTGRHMVHLLKRTPHAFGLDYSADLLAEARGVLGPEVPLIRGDMRQLPFNGAFDAVCNFFTSFGYFEDEAENAAVIRQMAAALKPGGQFFLDYFNRDYAMASLVAHSERSTGEYDIQDERWIDVENERLNKRTTVLRDGHLVDIFAESVRMYSPHALVNLLLDNGLQPETVYGDYSGAPLCDAQPRMIVVGTRK